MLDFCRSCPTGAAGFFGLLPISGKRGRFLQLGVLTQMSHDLRSPDFLRCSQQRAQSNGKSRTHSPEGALEDSPGREPGVGSGGLPIKPRRGDRSVLLSPLRGSGSPGRLDPQGLRPGLSSFVPPGLPTTSPEKWQESGYGPSEKAVDASSTPVRTKTACHWPDSGGRLLPVQLKRRKTCS